MLKSTPPMGAPKFDATPTAHAADRSDSRRDSFSVTTRKRGGGGGGVCV